MFHKGDIMAEEQQRVSGVRIAALVFTCICMLLGVTGFILTFAWKFLFAAIFCALFGLIGNALDHSRPKSQGIQRIIVMLLVLLIDFSMPPLSMQSSAKWQYRFQRLYAGCYHNSKEPEWFPDFLDDIESDYHFSYSPSVMQGTGWFTVRFQTSPERAAAYAAQFADGARYTIPVSEYGDRYIINAEKDEILYVQLDTAFWKDDPDAQIYVLDAVLNWNHPHSSAVIVDTKSGKIEFSQYG